MKSLRFLAGLACLALLCPGADFAEQLYKAGEKAERAGDFLHAYLLYSQAAKLEPANFNYAAHKSSMRTITAMSAREELGRDAATDETEDAPAVPRTSGTDLLEAREALAPPHLMGSPEKHSFDLKGDARTVFEQVAGAYGLQMQFEADYQPGPVFTFRLTDVSFQEALRALETVSNSFLVPVNPHLALVVRDTPQKRTELTQAEAIGIPIPERVSVQDAQEMMTAVQQTLDIRRVSVDPTRHMVFIRDQAPKVEAARQIFANLARGRPQVEIDVEFLLVAKNSSMSYGLSLPNQFALIDFGNFLNSTPSISSGFSTFLSFGGGKTLFGLGITEASAFASMAKSSTEDMYHAQMVSMDGQAATLHVGNRYPIIASGYYGTTTGTGTVYAPPPTINYEDLGLVLKITPSIHEDDEVSLDVDSEFKTIDGNSAISGIPIIGSRKFTGKVRVKEGEWAVIAGIMQFTDIESRTGIPGLANIPLIGRFLSQNSPEHDSAEVLIVLKPHLTNLPPWEFIPKSIWVGTETRPITLF